jgi:hypothetical protein
MKLVSLSGWYGFFISVCAVGLQPTIAVRAQEKANADELIIPLEEIWAYKMPGTREIEDVAKLADIRHLGSVVESSFRRAAQLKFKEVARSGFAVPGSGITAMRAALAVFDEGKPQNVFTPDDEITIVFFSEPSGGNHVRIEIVERVANRIEIQYWLEPYFESSLTETFALIPIDKLGLGKYHVEMRQLPRDQKFIACGYDEIDEDWGQKVLCKPFSFAVRPE